MTSSRLGSLAIAVSVGLLALALTLTLLPAGAFAAVYGRAIYPALSSALTVATGWTPFPLGALLVPPLLLLAIWRALAPGRPLGVFVRSARLALLLLTVWAGYVVIWGANYRWPPLLEVLELSGPAPGDEEMVALADELVRWVRVSERELRSRPQQAADAALVSVAGELERLALELGRPARLPDRVKILPAGTLLRAGYAGMLLPLTLEAQVDGALTASSRAALGAHELAHVAGFAAEADADLAALLASLRSNDDFARYAMALSLFSRMLSGLPPAEREELFARLPVRAKDDLAEARQRAAHYLRPSLSVTVTAVYDRLLRRQGVSGGVRAYGLIPRQAALARRHGLLPEPPLEPSVP